MIGETYRVTAWRPLPCRGPEAQLFVIGDVHGQAGALGAALDEIGRIPGTGLPRRLVFLGDLIDRGPDSLGAVRLAMGAADRAKVDAVTLLPGNHELMLIDGLLAPQEFMGDWLDNGGDAVIREADPGCTARKLRISRDWGSDFARTRALVSRHRGQPFRGRGQADRRLH